MLLVERAGESTALVKVRKIYQTKISSIKLYIYNELNVLNVKSIVQDCRISPSPCDVNANCVNTKRKTKGQYGGNAYRCACKPGYVGNGITCANEKTGNILYILTIC